MKLIMKLLYYRHSIIPPFNYAQARIYANASTAFIYTHKYLVNN